MGDIGVKYPEPGLIRVSVGGNDYLMDDEAVAALKSQNVPFMQGDRGAEQAGGYKESFGAGQQTAQDFERGAAHGTTLGFADKKFGDSNQSVMQRLGGDDYDAVKERSPVASGTGDFLGAVALPVPGGGATALGRIATQTALGAGMGAARAYAEGDDPGKAALLGGGLGFGGTGATEAVGAIAQKAAPYVSKALNATADAARTRGVFGIGGSDRQLMAIASKFGLDELPAKLAQKIEEMVPPQGLMGRSRDAYRKELEPIVESSGKDLGALRQHMGQDQGVNALIPKEYADMRQNLQDKLDNMIVRTDKDAAEQAALQRIVERMDQTADPKTLTELAAIKSHYQEAGHTGPLGTIPENASAEMNALTGKEGKDTLERLMNYATDDIHDATNAAAERYGTASMLNDQIAPKSLREQFSTNAAGLASTAASTLGGAAVGGISGLAEGHPISGAITGGTIGFGASMNTGTRNFMSQLLAQPKAMDTIANIARAAGKDLKSIDLNALRQLVAQYSGKLGGYLAE